MAEIEGVGRDGERGLGWKKVGRVQAGPKTRLRSPAAGRVGLNGRSDLGVGSAAAALLRQLPVGLFANDAEVHASRTDIGPPHHVHSR